MYTNFGTSTAESEAPERLASASADLRIAEVLAESWAERVSVRTCKLDLRAYYDKSIPDFPAAMVPFREDPRYCALDSDTRQKLLAAAWVSYNEKTIAVEKAVVAPACELLLRGVFAGADGGVFKRTIAQTIVDEQFHVLMCLDACLVARELHGIPAFRIPKPLVVEDLERARASAKTARDADLVQIAFATVAETSINAYLELLANDRSIQPLNRETTALHRKDESSHSKLFKAFTKALFVRLDETERRTYLSALAAGLESFARVDFGTWRAILEELRVEEAADIVERCLAANPSRRVFRDFSGFRGLLRDLGVAEREFAFRFESS